MAQQTLTDYDRLEISFKKNLVREVLPEYFAGEYPNVITFLEGYYDFLDSADNFGDMINDLYTIRDIEASSLIHLDNMFKEYALGMSQDFFKQPREILKNFAKFFRVKGSKYSAEGFFRGFFGEDIEVSYPKTDIFTLNDLEVDTVRLNASTIKQLFEDTNYTLKDVREKKLVKPVALTLLPQEIKMIESTKKRKEQFFS